MNIILYLVVAALIGWVATVMMNDRSIILLAFVHLLRGNRRGRRSI